LFSLAGGSSDFAGNGGGFAIVVGASGDLPILSPESVFLSENAGFPSFPELSALRNGGGDGEVCFPSSPDLTFLSDGGCLPSELSAFRNGGGGDVICFPPYLTALRDVASSSSLLLESKSTGAGGGFFASLSCTRLCRSAARARISAMGSTPPAAPLPRVGRGGSSVVAEACCERFSVTEPSAPSIMALFATAGGGASAEVEEDPDELAEDCLRMKKGARDDEGEGEETGGSSKSNERLPAALPVLESVRLIISSSRLESPRTAKQLVHTRSGLVSSR
jgi:hypothetical protein